MNPRSSSEGSVLSLRERLKAVARDTILEAAEQVFGDEGLDARMEAIASKAGVAVGTLYNHFADRQALLEALADVRREQLLSRLKGVADDVAGRPFEEQLVALLTVMSDLKGRHAKFHRSLLEAGLLQQARRRKEMRQRFAPLFTALFETGVKQGALRAAEPRLHGAHLMALMRATFELSLEHPELVPMAEVPRVVARTFLHGAGR